MPGEGYFLRKAAQAGAHLVGRSAQNRDGLHKTEQLVASAEDPIAAAEAVARVHRSSRRNKLLVTGAAAMAPVVAFASIFLVKKFIGEHAPSAHPVITQEQIGSAVTRIAIDPTVPVATVEGSASDQTTRPERIHVWPFPAFNFPGSANQSGARVVAQSYRKKVANRLNPLQVHSGYDIYTQPGGIILSGRKDPKTHKPQIVATIDVSQFNANLTNPRPYAPANLNNNGNQPLIWRAEYANSQAQWYLDTLQVAKNKFENEAAHSVQPAIPAGIAARIKSDTRQEANVLADEGDGLGAHILRLASAEHEPILLRFVSALRETAKPNAAQTLMNPSSIHVPVIDTLDTEQRSLMSNSTGNSQVLATLAAGQQALQLEREQGSLYVIGGFPDWTPSGYSRN